MSRKTLLLFTLFGILFLLFNTCKEPPTEAPIIITEITGKVFDKNSGVALQGVQISTLPITSSVVTATDGSYTIKDVSPDSYKISAQKDGYVTNSTDITVAEGKTVTADILLEIYTPTQIMGKVYDKKTNSVLSGVQISTQPTTSSVITGTDGVYTLEDVTPGDYKITAKKVDYNSSTIDVTALNGKTITADIHLDSQNPELKTTPEVLDFDVTQTSLTFSISNLSKVGELTWTIGLNQPWVSVSPSSGSTTTETDIVTVTVNRDNIDFGNYSAQITINSDYGVGQINVLMTKSNPNFPQLTVTPIELNFGKENNSKTIFIENTGTGTLTWTATTNESWILLSDNNGSVLGGNASNLMVSLLKTDLEARDYIGDIYINSNSGSKVVSVSMIVEQGTLDPPTLQIIGDATKTSIPLGWTKVNDANFNSYKLYRSTINNVDENSTLVTTITNSDQNTYTDVGLNSGTVYYYKVFVYSRTGIGSASNEVSATTSRNVGAWVSTETITSLNYGITNNSIHIVTKNDIWLAGEDEIWHYNGNTWSKDFTSIENKNFTALTFINSNNGWAIDNGWSTGSLYKYNGINWTKISNLSLSNASDIIAFSENNIWILGYDEVYHFNGSNWIIVSLDIGLGIDLDATSENDIWALGERGEVFHYNGVGWSKLGDLEGNFKAISANNQNDVWIASSSNRSDYRAYYSGLWHYNGDKFNKDHMVSEGVYYGPRNSISMLSPNEGWSSFYNSPYSFSYFDGNSWQDVVNPVNSRIKCIKFLSRDKGWAVTDNGTILRYVE